MLIRLDKYLADMQVGTRSEVKELIRKKRVTVNDNIVTKPESKINTDGDSVNVGDSRSCAIAPSFVIIRSPSVSLSSLPTGKRSFLLLVLIRSITVVHVLSSVAETTPAGLLSIKYSYS